MALEPGQLHLVDDLPVPLEGQLALAPAEGLLSSALVQHPSKILIPVQIEGSPFPSGGDLLILISYKGRSVLLDLAHAF